MASRKHRLEHNNLGTILWAKLKGAYVLSKSLQFVKPRTQMQILAGMDMVVIEDYYHMTTTDENLGWMKQTHIYCRFFL